MGRLPPPPPRVPAPTPPPGPALDSFAESLRRAAEAFTRFGMTAAQASDAILSAFREAESDAVSIGVNVRDEFYGKLERIADRLERGAPAGPAPRREIDLAGDDLFREDR